MKHLTKRPTSFDCNDTFEGEPIEIQVARMMENIGEIEEVSPLLYQERDEGINPNYDIRTDIWQLRQDAIEQADKAAEQKELEEQQQKSANPTENE